MEGFVSGAVGEMSVDKVGLPYGISRKTEQELKVDS